MAFMHNGEIPVNMHEEEMQSLEADTHNNTELQNSDVCAMLLQANKAKEDLLQQLHCLQLKLNAKIALEIDQRAEIDILHEALVKDKDEGKKSFNRIEAEFARKEYLLKQQVESLEAALEEQETKYKQELGRLRNELCEVKSKKKECENCIILRDDIDNWKGKSEKVGSECQKLQVNMLEVHEENATFRKEINNLKEQLQELQNILQVRETENSSCSLSLESAQEEIILLRSELDNMKSGADENRKGNSLFAEIEDKRQQLQKTVDKLKAKCIEYQKRHRSKCSEVFRLQAEKAELLRKLKHEQESSQNEHLYRQIGTYKNQVDELSDKLRELQSKQDLGVKIVFSYDEAETSSVSWLQSVIDKMEKEVKKKDEEICTQRMKVLLESDKLFDAECILRQKEAQITELNAEVVKLNSLLEKREDEALDAVDEELSFEASVVETCPVVEGSRKLNFNDNVKVHTYAESPQGQQYAQNYVENLKTEKQVEVDFENKENIEQNAASSKIKGRKATKFPVTYISSEGIRRQNIKIENL